MIIASDLGFFGPVLPINAAILLNFVLSSTPLFSAISEIIYGNSMKGQ